MSLVGVQVLNTFKDALRGLFFFSPAAGTQQRDLLFVDFSLVVFLPPPPQAPIMDEGDLLSEFMTAHESPPPFKFSAKAAAASFVANVLVREDSDIGMKAAPEAPVVEPVAQAIDPPLSLVVSTHVSPASPSPSPSPSPPTPPPIQEVQKAETDIKSTSTTGAASSLPQSHELDEVARASPAPSPMSTALPLAPTNLEPTQQEQLARAPARKSRMLRELDSYLIDGPAWSHKRRE
jgi:hypothetical protein